MSQFNQISVIILFPHDGLQVHILYFTIITYSFSIYNHLCVYVREREREVESKMYHV